MAIRFGRKTEENWKDMEVNVQAVEKTYRKRKGRIMFPSSHDITENERILAPCLTVLHKMLESGNEVLITTKPRLTVIQQICTSFACFRELLQFRFTIGSKNDELFRFWEPGAPSYQERLDSLIHANQKGFMTSVSIEPFLDYSPVSLVLEIQPYVTESIWVGIMNYISRKGLSEEEEKHYSKIRKNYSKRHLWEIYSALESNPLIRWKDSIKKKLDLLDQR